MHFHLQVHMILLHLATLFHTVGVLYELSLHFKGSYIAIGPEFLTQ